jgi:glycosyltransferase involved in cell wall biosynthesis
MKALFVTNRWPDPLSAFRHGTALRMRLLLKSLAAAGYDVDLLAYAPAGTSIDAGVANRIRADLRDGWRIPVATVFLANQGPKAQLGTSFWQDCIWPALSARWQPPFQQMAGRKQRHAFEDALAKSSPQLLFVHRLPAFVPVLAAQADLPSTVFDLDDIEHKAFDRLLAQPPHWRSKRLRRGWLPVMKRLERRAVKASERTLVCSAADADELNQMFSTDSVIAVPNALPSPMPSALPDEPNVLFLGTYDYPPNQLAAESLIHDIWPLVNKRYPQARLRIAGKAVDAIRGHDRPPPGVEILGFVDDLDALYASTQLVVCPLLSGGGTRIKIIEAALRARPVVSTTIGAEGLDLNPASGEIVIADGNAEFADSVCRLLGDPNEASRIGARSRAKATGLYEEAAVMRQLSSVFHTAVAAR